MFWGEKIIKAKTLIDNVEYEEALECLNDLERKEALDKFFSGKKI
jgi:hypothetical protein